MHSTFLSFISVRSAIALIQELLSIPGVNFVLTEKWNQDALEQYFGKQRMRGGANENPTVLEYSYNTPKLITAGSKIVRDVAGNVKKRTLKLTEVDETPLPPTRKKK